ncbi:uncharacterized protein LY89DRAFT_685953 [Mollisia scopiformis]|uniref:Uncharacterized protein n=1 Tax=Mollisia scopiformis TaxID=149040 RepID=A0A194X5R6_MOLSC|nr:uncharacterized protein LY89DRAFT_685953 [Mollisia scopiformis]KUJ15137.1 hypothetical protein LY89DRAFT_685953 [Mollisia scopiformis]
MVGRKTTKTATLMDKMEVIVNPTRKKGKDAVQLKIDVYTQAASVLTVPKFGLSHSSHISKNKPRLVYQSSIELPAFDIRTTAEAPNSSAAGKSASLQFLDALGRARREEEPLDDGTSGLDVTNAKEFVEYCSSLLGMRDFVVKVNGNAEWKYNGGHSFEAQVFADDAAIGDSVTMQDNRSATKLAYLTAAVHLALKGPMVLVQFLENKNDGKNDSIQNRTSRRTTSIE